MTKGSLDSWNPRPCTRRLALPDGPGRLSFSWEGVSATKGIRPGLATDSEFSSLSPCQRRTKRLVLLLGLLSQDLVARVNQHMRLSAGYITRVEVREMASADRVPRRLILLVFILALPASQLSAQPETATAPVLKPGEYWVRQWEEDFRGKRSGTYRRTVVRKDSFEGQDVYILSRGDGTFSVVDLDLATIATIDGAGNVKVRYGRKGDRTFPLFVGKIYTQDYDNPVSRYRGTYKQTVTGIEEVRTPAGTFTTFRVLEEGKGTFYNGQPFTERGIYHFAPAAKAWVKYSFSVDSGYQYSDELVSYQVVPD